MSKLPQVEQGVYILKQDVTNPKANKRRRAYFWCSPVFKAGTLFIIEPFDSDTILGQVIRRVGSLEYLTLSTTNEEVVNLLLPHLERGVSIKDVMMEAREIGIRVNTQDIIDEMLLAGKICEDDIKEAIASYRSRKRVKP